MTGFASKKKMALSRMSDEITLRRISSWQLAFCWKPEKCYLTGKLLFGVYAYCGYFWNPYNEDTKRVIVKYWVDKNEFIIWQLKQ